MIKKEQEERILQQVIAIIQEYRDESLNQGLEFDCSDETFDAIMHDLLLYLAVIFDLNKEV